MALTSTMFLQYRNTQIIGEPVTVVGGEWVKGETVVLVELGWIGRGESDVADRRSFRVVGRTAYSIAARLTFSPREQLSSLPAWINHSTGRVWMDN